MSDLPGKLLKAHPPLRATIAFSVLINELSASEQISGKSEGAGKQISFVVRTPIHSALSPIGNHESNA